MSPHRIVVSFLSTCLFIWGVYLFGSWLVDRKLRSEDERVRVYTDSLWELREKSYPIAYAHVKELREQIQGRICNPSLVKPGRMDLVFSPHEHHQKLVTWTRLQEAACGRPVLEKLEAQDRRPVTRLVLREIVDWKP